VLGKNVQMLAQDKCPPLGLPTTCPAECQSMAAGMTAGYPAVAHYLGDFNRGRLKSATAGQEPRNRMVGTLTETTNPCC